MDTPALIGLAAAGLAYLLSGLVLAGSARTRTSGILLTAAGVATVASAVLVVRQPDSTATHAVVALGWVMLMPLSVATYPDARWRQPLDVAALFALGAVGTMAVVRADDFGWVGTAALASACILLAYVWWRFERAAPADRRALLWMALAITTAAIVLFVNEFMALGAVGEMIAFLSLGLVGPAMVVGVRRPEVIDVRGLVVAVAVMVTAWAVYLALFMAAASALELLGGEVPQVVTLGVVGALAAATFHPLQVQLRGVMDELLFGRRPDPLEAAAQVVGQVGDDPLLALRAIRGALVLPYAQLSVPGEPALASGEPVAHTATIPLALADGAVGELVIGLRPGDLRVSGGDARVLGLVAPLLAQTMRARTLAAELGESRGQVITAVAEERRRLRRDLHDGLGPRLSGIAFTADAARNLLRTDPEAAERLLAVLRQETVTAIEDIRALVYAMRPPALDEIGLVPALRQQALLLRTPDDVPLQVDLTASELPALPAAVEVAAYRIVVEALTNAARHSGSSEAGVRLAVDGDRLEIEVHDAGRAPATWHTGVGVSSMRERAAELGGTLEACGTPEGGIVRATLPFVAGAR